MKQADSMAVFVDGPYPVCDSQNENCILVVL